MRIMHLSTRLILGGSQENTVLSCEGQARLGHEVHLGYGPIFGPEGSLFGRASAFRADDGRGIAMHEVPDLCREVSPRRDARCLGQLKDLIRRIRPDIVHTHSSKAGILGRLAAWSALGERDRPGIVHTIHGPPFMPVEGSAVARFKRRAVNAVYAVSERIAARRCHVIVSVADAMTEQFLARGIGRPGQYVTVHSGMEVERYLTPSGPDETREAVRGGLGFSPADFVIGTVARLAEHKGHDDLLDACGGDLRSNPGWKLLWVGDGWWRDRLLARVRAMGLDGRVITAGLVPSERVASYMRAMDLLVHPSYREGLPRTVPQALLCGTAVVAYDVDGTKEACIEGRTGRLVPPGDTGALRRAVRWMYDHPDERARLAEHGRDVCRVRFDARLMVERLDAVYARALGLSRGGPPDPAGPGAAAEPRGPVTPGAP
ncbi:MAG: glycosyltransferase family 4 protein [Phycisphaeraceae bacterium]|nr:MAG: glycosyltransferase family 4 protein [Phycisphaeraceae bacterium]